MFTALQHLFCLFLAEANELILVIAEGANNIRLPIGSGLAGSVAESGESLNIPDAYEDARFSSAFDKASGFRTRAVMAVPVRDPADGSIVAILQTINKTDEGVFTVDDQMLLENFAFHVGVTLHNIKLYESELAAKTKVRTTRAWNTHVPAISSAKSHFVFNWDC